MADKDFVVKNGLTVNGSVLVVNTSTGFVGVNTSQPDATLKVSGTANVSGNAVFSGNLTVTGSQLNVSTAIVGSANTTFNIVSAVNVTSTNISGNGAAVTSVNAAAVGGNTASDLRNYTVSFASNASNINTGTLSTSLFPATANITTAINIGANVTINASAIGIGNTTVNFVANSTTISGGANATFNIISGNGVNITSVNAIAVGGNSASDLRSYSDTIADTAYSNGVSYSSNASNISSGTLNTARLPSTVNVSAVLNVGANVNVNTSTIYIGNSTVNFLANSSTISGSTNATFNIISGNGVNITSVNAATVGGNTAATLRSYSDSGAGTAYSNAVSYAASIAGTAYSNAVSYAASIAGTAYSNAVGAIATSIANAANYVIGGGSVSTNTFTIGTAAYHVSNGNFGISTSTPSYPLDVNGNANISGAIRLGQAIVETYAAPSISGGALTLDLSTATVFNVSLNANITTFTISNATSSRAQAFTIFFTADGTQRTITWGSSVKWPGGTGPTMTATNTKKDVLTLVTNDGGTTWYGFVGGQNF